MSIRHIAETHGPDAARRVVCEARQQFADLGLDARSIANARTLHKLKTFSHVVVGDHTPEPRSAVRDDDHSRLRSLRIRQHEDPLMPYYTVEIEHRERDQVFSYYHGDALLHFNASLLARMREAMPDEFIRVTMQIGQDEYDLCMKHRGIEEDKVTNLTPLQIDKAGYGVLFDDNGSFTIVDGHHRLVKRFRNKRGTMDFYIAPEAIWKHCLVTYTAEADERIKAGMPPKVEDVTFLPSVVRLHDQE